MIKFEAVAKKESAETRSQDTGALSDSKLTIDEAKKISDSLFEKSSSELYSDMLEEVLDYDKEDCVFDFDATDKDIRGILSEIRDKWYAADDNEKMALCDEFAKVLFEKMGIENPPRCVYYYDDNENNFGFYSKADNTININTKFFDDVDETIDTIAHESRHAYQDRRAAIGETYIDELYKCNLENYISLEYVDGYCVNFLDYQNQFVEVEARAFAEMFKL